MFSPFKHRNSVKSMTISHYFVIYTISVKEKFWRNKSAYYQWVLYKKTTYALKDIKVDMVLHRNIFMSILHKSTKPAMLCCPLQVSSSHGFSPAWLDIEQSYDKR